MQTQCSLLGKKSSLQVNQITLSDRSFDFYQKRERAVAANCGGPAYDLRPSGRGVIGGWRPPVRANNAARNRKFPFIST
jgi:hypothetical protein